MADAAGLSIRHREDGHLRGAYRETSYLPLIGDLGPRRFSTCPAEPDLKRVVLADQVAPPGMACQCRLQQADVVRKHIPAGTTEVAQERVHLQPTRGAISLERGEYLGEGAREALRRNGSGFPVGALEVPVHDIAEGVHRDAVGRHQMFADRHVEPVVRYVRAEVIDLVEEHHASNASDQLSHFEIVEKYLW